MRQPIRWDLYADRGVAFSEVLPIVGYDFTSATFSAQVRTSPDALGAPIKTLSVALTYGGSDTVGNHVSAGRLSTKIYDYGNPATGAKYAAGDTVALSVIHVSLSDVALGIQQGVPRGTTVNLAWDMLITPSGGTADKWIYGTFAVRGTVTQ